MITKKITKHNGSDRLQGVEDETALGTNITTEQVKSRSKNAESQTEKNQVQTVQEGRQETLEANTVVATTRETEEKGDGMQQVGCAPPEQEQSKPDIAKIKTKGKVSVEQMQALSPEQVTGLTRAEQLRKQLGALFKPNDWVCLLNKTKTSVIGRRGFVFPGITFKCRELVKLAVEICEKGMLTSEFGSAIRVNAVSEEGSGNRKTHKDCDVTCFRQMVIETDYPSQKRQLFFIGQIPERITTIVATGGRGFHVTIRIDAKNKEEYDKISSEIYAKYDCLTVCQNSRNPSRTLRIAGSIRHSVSRPKDNVVQRLIYLNNNPDGHPILSANNGRCLLSM